MSKRTWFADSPTPKSVQLPKELDRRLKLTDEQISEAKELYKNGHTSRFLGKKYGVSKTAILHHVNEETKERNNARRRALNKKLRTDAIYRKKKSASNREAFKRKKKLLPEFRKVIHEYEYRRRARILGIFSPQ